MIALVAEEEGFVCESLVQSLKPPPCMEHQLINHKSNKALCDNKHPRYRLALFAGN